MRSVNEVTATRREEGVAFSAETVISGEGCLTVQCHCRSVLLLCIVTYDFHVSNFSSPSCLVWGYCTVLYCTRLMY